MLVLVCLEIVLFLTQDRCTVCAERTKAQKPFWTHPMDLLSDIGHLESRFNLFGDTLELVQDRCTVCAKRRSEIILGCT
jgi:hypothetical protein